MITAGPLLEALEAVHSGRLRPMEAYRQIRAAETGTELTDREVVIVLKWHDHASLGARDDYELRRRLEQGA